VVHVSHSFEFTIDLPVERAAPLFGPEGERAWAGDDWDPHFVYPQPAKDIEGSVFTIRHAAHTATWVNTVFDLRSGRMQYVYFIANIMTATIDVKLTSEGNDRTRVWVRYQRTALSEEGAEHVRAVGDKDAKSGPEWKAQIDAMLAKERAH